MPIWSGLSLDVIDCESYNVTNPAIPAIGYRFSFFCYTAARVKLVQLLQGHHIPHGVMMTITCDNFRNSAI